MSANNSFLCSVDQGAASHFCVCQSNPVFLCSSCLSKHKEEPLHDTFPIANIGLFRVLNYNKAELQRRRNLSNKCTAFLDQVALISEATDREAYAILERFYKHYRLLQIQRKSVLRTVLNSMRYELSALMKTAKLEFSLVPEALVRGFAGLDKLNVSQFTQLPESVELQNLDQRCEEALNWAPRVWQQKLEERLLQLVSVVSEPQPARPESMPTPQYPESPALNPRPEEARRATQASRFPFFQEQGKMGFEMAPSVQNQVLSEGRNEPVGNPSNSTGQSPVFLPRGQGEMDIQKPSLQSFSPQGNPQAFSLQSPQYLSNPAASKFQMVGNAGISQWPSAQSQFGNGQLVRQEGLPRQMGSGNQHLRGYSGEFGQGMYANQEGGPLQQGGSPQFPLQGHSPVPQTPNKTSLFSAVPGRYNSQNPAMEPQDSARMKPMFMTTQSPFQASGMNPSIDSPDQIQFPMRTQPLASWQVKPQVVNSLPQKMQGFHRAPGDRANPPLFAQLDPVQYYSFGVNPADPRAVQPRPNMNNPYIPHTGTHSGSQTCVQCGYVVNSDLIYADITCATGCSVCKRCIYTAVLQGIYRCPKCNRSLSEEEVDTISAYGMSLF